MALNELHHNKTLSALHTEASWAKYERRLSRYGRNGETSGGGHARVASKAYNKAYRKASKQQLSGYQIPLLDLKTEDDNLMSGNIDGYMDFDFE